MSSRRIRAAIVAVIGLVAGGLALAGPAQAATSASVRPATPGVYLELLNAHTNKCADVADWSTSPGGVIHQWHCANPRDANQLWAIEPVNGFDGFVKLRNLNSQLCMSAGPPYTNGVLITQAECDSVFTDDWWGFDDDGGFVKVRQLTSGHCLDLKNGSRSDGAIIQLLDCSSSSNAQDWYFG